MSQCLCLKQKTLQAEVRQSVTSLWVPEEVPEGGVSLHASWGLYALGLRASWGLYARSAWITEEVPHRDVMTERELVFA